MLYRCHFFHISEFFLDMRYYLVVLMVIQIFWDVKLCQLVYSWPAFWRHMVSLTSESTQSKYCWFYLTLKMGSLHFFWKFTECLPVDIVCNIPQYLNFIHFLSYLLNRL